MTVTASSMIFRALRLNGAKGMNDTLSSNEQTNYLQDLNSMMDSWSLERLLCYQILQESFALSASTGSYTIGTGGVFNTARPTKIVDPCFVRDASNLDSPISLINTEAYGRIVQKSAGVTYPSFLYYDQGYSSSGLATIQVYPTPSASLTLFINSWKQLQSFGAISTAIVLPPGYQRAIEFNLCVDLAGGFKSVQPEVASVARAAKASLKGVNLPDTMMKLDYAITGNTRRGQSILTG